MPFDLPLATAAALACALLAAAFVRGYSGFGFSAIFIAFAALLTNPLPLIPVVFLCEILMTVFQARGIRGQVDWRRVSALLAGAAIALPFAVTLVLSLGDANVRLTVSLIVGIMALVLLSGWTLQRRIGAPGTLGVGLLSGAINSAGVGGLPVAAFLSAQPMQAATFRATMIIYLTGLDLLTLPLMALGGIVSWDTALAALLCFPILACGVWLGGRRFLSTPPATFRKFAVLLLLILAGLGLIRAMLS
ncbi:sulfite exporter TauE/SafE family protein [Loktanella agnita]|uniref:sulfite exporter TauE/SafE family protein n=1 Tax=Loktanella agnita TaxID=287097 RepID=UPI00398733C9